MPNSGSTLHHDFEGHGGVRFEDDDRPVICPCAHAASVRKPSGTTGALGRIPPARNGVKGKAKVPLLDRIAAVDEQPVRRYRMGVEEINLAHSLEVLDECPAVRSPKLLGEFRIHEALTPFKYPLLPEPDTRDTVHAPRQKTAVFGIETDLLDETLVLPDIKERLLSSVRFLLQLAKLGA